MRVITRGRPELPPGPRRATPLHWAGRPQPVLAWASLVTRRFRGRRPVREAGRKLGPSRLPPSQKEEVLAMAATVKWQPRPIHMRWPCTTRNHERCHSGKAMCTHVCVCECVCMCVRTYMCMCACMCARVCTHVGVHVCAYMCACVCTHGCVRTCTYACQHMCTGMHTSVRMCVCMPA